MTPLTIDLDALKAAIYAWPYSPLDDCLAAAGIPLDACKRLILLDPSVESAVTFWLVDRAELEDAGD